MPQTQLSTRLGTNNTIFDVDEKPRVPRSKFDLSRKNMTTIDLGGIYPVDFFPVFPSDHISLSVRYLLDTLPLAVPPMNNYRVRTHWYFCKMSALWKGWESFVTKGRSGSIEMQIPTVSAADLDAPRDGERKTVPMGLASFLGIKAKFVSDQTSASDAIFLPYCKNGVATVPNVNRLTTGYNVLPFMMYQKIYRDNYAPVNLLTDNHVWFPDDLADEWRIDYAASNVGHTNNQQGLFFVPTGSVASVSQVKANYVPKVDDTVVDLLQLRYACYENDYFTSAKPWLVRGGQPASADIEFLVKELENFLTFSGEEAEYQVSRASKDSKPYPVGSSNPATDSDPVSQVAWWNIPNAPNAPPTDTSHPALLVQHISQASGVSYLNNWYTLFTKVLPKGSIKVNNATGKIHASLTANTLRNMLALSVWQERNAVASGNYNALIRAHFNSSPKSPEWEPVYLGGTSDVVSFGQVLQTSQGDSSSPLGTQAGMGSASGQGHVFEFDSRDYGYIMGLMIISPEVVYTQGIDRVWTDTHQSEIFYPEYANLGYEPILNRELFVTGNEATDKGLAGYQTRLAYLKQRRNVAGGLFSLPAGTDKLFSAYVQAREFTSLPKLSAEFVSMSPANVRRDFLAFTKQPAFKLQFASDVSCVRALPFQSTPNTFGF
ncbi:MAG: hypothetical protein HDR35_04705 [Treponema sp.]|nr:hypothetical protein [Treponema sp.]